MSRFAGRHALVTGAGSSIGREVALGLSREVGQNALYPMRGWT
jgi:NAD(P)-dependent dehydrogenase (short-subunit alcohol dehydrogenase family)